MVPKQVVPDRRGLVEIGKIKENLVTEVAFDCADLGDGSGAYAVVFQRPKDAAPYPVAFRAEWPSIVWVVQAADTAKPGTGKVEIRWYGDGDQVGKSKTYMVRITDGLPDPTEAPEAWEGFIGQVARDAETAQAAAEAAKTAQSGAEAAKLAAGESATGAAGSAEAAAQAAQEGQSLYNQVKADLAAGKLKGEKGEKGDPGKDAPQIDDNTVSAENPWSSRHIVETLCPKLEETGNPVTCYPVAGYPLGVVASWTPTQAGEGEPYPAGGGPNLLDISKCTVGVGAFGLVLATVGDVLTIKGTVTSVAPDGDTSFFGVLDTPDSSLSGKGYKITAFTSKGSIKKIYGLRTETETSIAIGMNLVVGQVVDVALRIMVSKDTPTAYAPYENIRPISGREAVEIRRNGENLHDFLADFPAGYKNTVNGVTIEVMADGRAHVYGTHTSDGYTNVLFKSLPSEKWRIFPAGTYTAGNGIAFGFLNDSGLWINHNKTFTLDKAYVLIGLYISVFGKKTFDFYCVPILVAGTTAPTSYAPYKGDTLDLQLPETVYGGTVDAVTGAGNEEWGLATFDGSEAWTIGGIAADKRDWYYVSSKIAGAINGPPKSGNEICSHYPHYDVANNNTNKGCALVWGAFRVRWGDIIPENTDAWKAYLAAQAAAGSPVQIAYKLATPTSFTATGNGPIMPLDGKINTIMTDADNVTVTGRADPVHAIAALQAQLAVATQQLAETQQAIVDTTAMAVDYIYQQDLEDIGLEEVDDSDNQTDTEPVDVPGV